MFVFLLGAVIGSVITLVILSAIDRKSRAYILDYFDLQSNRRPKDKL
jgi:hypothetical protein